MKKKLKEDLKKAEERRNQYFFGIREKGKDDLIGVLSFHWVQTSSQVGHLRMNFGEKDHAKEYAQEVLALALRYAFMELSLHRVTAQTQGHREDEIKLLEQAGFLRESQRRQAVFQDGKYRDELVYGLLRNEWKERNKEVQA
jgi:RimJ/RimL family protein N-acetyltransferase